ncbi:sulfite exporter TauE/SafE family protein [uncultured Sunxiuqinia sp.]|uniref:sulfite exporter TauE/SafE family protein n=1 Tax=uncultured Sunxiuqinia sp. TaxID=1573825 RepID=UPI0030DD2354|tara:strand:+ start:2077 stop:2832 length:756 start_codon:yes stop_codon:yes gene_type:complete
MEVLSPFDLTPLQWVLMAVSGMLIGMSKVGVPGVSMIVVPVLAFIFGGKQSTGVLLPILMMADLFGVGYYRRHAQWSYLVKILPWAFLGVGLALWVGEVVNDEQFKDLIAILVFVCIGLMLWRDRRKDKTFFPDSWWFAASMGVLGGFATMIGNVAGPIFAIYLLAMHLPKNSFIGTSAWFFLILNFSKFPLHIFVWETITWPSLKMDLMVLPAIALGAFLGILLVRKIPEKAYRTAVIVITAISAFLLLI